VKIQTKVLIAILSRSNSFVQQTHV